MAAAAQLLDDGVGDPGSLVGDTAILIGATLSFRPISIAPDCAAGRPRHADQRRVRRRPQLARPDQGLRRRRVPDPPTEYGVWGILVAALGTLLWLKQVGIGDKYVQQEDDDQELAFQQAFTLELALQRPCSWCSPSPPAARGAALRVPSCSRRARARR